jgi:hypothetical protein
MSDIAAGKHMRRLFGLFLLFAAFGFARDSHAAEFIWTPHSGKTGLGALYMIGTMVPGDYERFVSAIKSRGAAPFILYVRSQGGDVSEALKIGRLVRELTVSAMAPLATTYSAGAASCLMDEKELGRKVPCICASACTLVWFGSPFRTGLEIFIHSIAYDKKTFSSLPPAEAERMYRQSMNDIRAYLAEMNISDKYAQLMTETGSVELKKVRAQDDWGLFGFDGGYREWLFAKCGPPSNALTPDGQSVWGSCTVKVEGDATVEAIRRVLGVQ